jgi:polyisoprenyl-teichoic acid--peptidoglycan teichoic acid transferase
MSVMLALTVVASFMAYSYMRRTIGNGPVSIVEFQPTATPIPSAASAAPTAAVSDAYVLPAAWNGKERLNILLMGIDQRETNEKERVFRTDTMLVLTIDPASMQAGMLSLPRDLWVPISAYEINDRINTANYWGDANDYPNGGGPQLARKTVENVLGIRIHHYVRINFTVFENLIDRLGGIEVDVAADIYDDAYPTEDYGTEVFQIKKGRQTLDGATALKYARTRKSTDDFDRARRQQQVILAIRDRAQDPRVLASLVAGAPDMLNTFGAAVKTDMTMTQMQQLAVLAQRLEKGKIKSAVLDENYTDYAFTPKGDSVLIGNREKIATLRNAFFSVDGVAASVTPTP